MHSPGKFVVVRATDFPVVKYKISGNKIITTLLGKILHRYKKFREEIIAYFPFTFDTTWMT
jgi:hypothetical protein